ncbi:MAG: NUDIX domain-containing protein [Firmicutes bacterium]|nr:NUDIX domain-containing protein [Bacillota bacterium]
MEVIFLDHVEDELLKFAVIISFYHGKLVLCRHKDRDTYEIPGGHREADESILDCAKRELFEETGAIAFDIEPLCAYATIGKNRVNVSGDIIYGMLFVADIKKMGKLEYEISEILLVDKLVDNLTYPDIQPLFMEEYNRRKGVGDTNG